MQESIQMYNLYKMQVSRNEVVMKSHAVRMLHGFSYKQPVVSLVS